MSPPKTRAIIEVGATRSGDVKHPDGYLKFNIKDIYVATRLAKYLDLLSSIRLPLR